MDRRRCRRRIRFIVDKMHGDLARWLRILGYDTLTPKNVNDRDMIERALAEDRVLVSRDKGLVSRARKKGVRAYMVTGVDPEDKLAELAFYTGICLDYTGEHTRCPECNAVLEKVSKEDVKGQVPPKVYDSYDTFFRCPRCGKVYWHGSHWVDIQKRLESAKEQLERMRRWSL